MSLGGQKVYEKFALALETGFAAATSNDKTVKKVDYNACGCLLGRWARTAGEGRFRHSYKR